MPKISTDNYDTVAAWNGSQDLFVVGQPDGTKVATPAMVKQFIEAGDFEATGEVKDGHGNILKDMAKSADVDAKIGDLSQTGLTGDSAADQLADIAANLIKRSAGSSITVTMPVVWGYFYPDQYTAKVPIPTIAPNTNYTIMLEGVKADNVPATVDILTGAEVVSKNNTYFEMRTPRNLSSY